MNDRLKELAVDGKYSYSPVTEITQGNSTRINLVCNVCNHKWNTTFNSLNSAKSACPQCKHTKKVDASYIKVTEILKCKNIEL